jgi:hypothetical protein
MKNIIVVTGKNENLKLKYVNDNFNILNSQIEINPENNLHTSKQFKKLLKIIREFLSSDKENLVISTNSPYILTTMNNVIYISHLLEALKLYKNEIPKNIRKSLAVYSKVYPSIYGTNFKCLQIDKNKIKSIIDAESRVYLTDNYNNSFEFVDKSSDVFPQILTESIDKISDTINHHFDEFIEMSLTLEGRFY